MTINPGCTNFGASFQAIVGGYGNQSIGMLSTIGGGKSNTVSPGAGAADAIAGGNAETLSSATNELTRVGSTTNSP